MSKTTTVQSQVTEHKEMSKPKKGWVKTLQVLSNGNVRIIAAKRP